MRHRVLDDERLDPVRMGQGHAKPDRSTVILDVERVVVEPKCFGEAVHDLGTVIECVGEFFRVRPAAVSKAGVIGRYKMIAIGKPGKERLEHPR